MECLLQIADSNTESLKSQVACDNDFTDIEQSHKNEEI